MSRLIVADCFVECPALSVVVNKRLFAPSVSARLILAIPFVKLSVIIFLSQLLFTGMVGGTSVAPPLRVFARLVVGGPSLQFLSIAVIL